ncbi:MAG: hypothetical protein WD069_10410, partial [Planctomycetales bacterium]
MQLIRSSPFASFACFCSTESETGDREDREDDSREHPNGIRTSSTLDVNEIPAIPELAVAGPTMNPGARPAPAPDRAAAKRALAALRISPAQLDALRAQGFVSTER